MSVKPLAEDRGSLPPILITTIEYDMRDKQVKLIHNVTLIGPCGDRRHLALGPKGRPRA
jgi:hypothetical protein